MKRIHIHIDRLTLEGKTPAEARTIVAAIERRVSELANRAPARLAGSGAGTVAHGASPDAIGSQFGAHIAAQVFRKPGGKRNA